MSSPKKFSSVNSSGLILLLKFLGEELRDLGSVGVSSIQSIISDREGEVLEGLQGDLRDCFGEEGEMVFGLGFEGFRGGDLGFEGFRGGDLGFDEVSGSFCSIMAGIWGFEVLVGY